MSNYFFTLFGFVGICLFLIMIFASIRAVFRLAYKTFDTENSPFDLFATQIFIALLFLGGIFGIFAIYNFVCWIISLIL